MRLLTICAVLFLLSGVVDTAKATSLSELQGASFGEIGYLEQVTCPIGGRYDCLTFPDNMYRLNNTCFTAGYGSLLLGYGEGMFAQLRSGRYVVIVKTGSDRFEVADVEHLYECPRRY
jgi:hypothetical protein